MLHRYCISVYIYILKYYIMYLAYEYKHDYRAMFKLKGIAACIDSSSTSASIVRLAEVECFSSFTWRRPAKFL